MLRMKVHARGSTYWPLQLQQEGWSDEMDIRTCGVIAVIAKPFATQSQIITSLEIMLKQEQLNAKLIPTKKSTSNKEEK